MTVPVRPIGYYSVCSALFLLILWACVGAGAAEMDQDVIEALKERGDPVDVIWLESSGGRFPALYTASTKGLVKGGVLLVHDVAAHPDWPGVVHPLRSRLPDFGWHTLAMRAPAARYSQSHLLVRGALEEGGEQIGAGLAHFKQQDVPNVVLLGYGWGAVVAARYLADNPDSDVTAAVLISPVVPGGARLPLVSWLEKITLPVFDVFGSRDLAMAKKDAPTRRRAGRGRDGVPYRQIMIDGADHAYSGLEDVLIKRVRGWLEVNATGIEIEAEKP